MEYQKKRGGYQIKIFFLVRPAIEYRISNDFNKSNSSTPLFLNLNPPKERGTFEIRTVKYIFYEDGEKVQVVRDIDTQLVQSCLVLNLGATKTFIYLCIRRGIAPNPKRPSAR